jgi:multidrug efflux pump subunit AcrB
MSDNSQLNSDATHRGLIAWFARNGVAANLLMGIIILLGFITAASIRTQALPDQELARVTVDVPYPGASPAEVETGVVIKIEDALREIQGISEYQSFSNEGMARIHVDVDSDFEVQTLLDEVKLAVDRIPNFPNEIEKPRIYKSEVSSTVMYVQLFGNLNDRELKELAIRIRDEIQGLPHVTAARLFGGRPYEVSIELRKSVLQHYGLTLQQVADAIRQSSLDVPAGSIKTDSGDIMLRTQGQAYVQTDFDSIPLLTDPNGVRLTLADVADVTDGFAEVDVSLLFDNKPSVGIAIDAVGNQNALTISEEVRNYVAEKEKVLPEGVSISTWGDISFYLESTLKMMNENFAFGAVLVFMVLGIFLRVQLAFWVIVGLPICFLGAIILMPLAEISVNIISLFGFILVLGIVVDDAIIIGESAQSFSEQDGHSTESIIKGAQRVTVPATFGVLTTIAAFIPMLLVGGAVATTAEAIGGVVILCLIFSLIESKLILPSHLAHMAAPSAGNNRNARGWGLVQSKFDIYFKKMVDDYYRPFLVYAVHRRYNTVAIFVAALFIAIGIVASPLIHVVLFPQLPSDFISASVEIVDGAPSSQTEKIVRELASRIREIDSEYSEDQKFLKHMFERVNGSNGGIVVELSKGEDREVNAVEIANEWRRRVGDIAGTKKLQIVGSTAIGGGTTFNFQLLSNNPVQLKAAAKELQEMLRTYDGVYDIESTSTSGAQEINLSIKPSAEVLGLTLEDLAYQVRAAFYGIEAQRIQRGTEEVRVMVRYSDDERVSVGNLESMYIRAPDGAEVPFNSVAEAHLQSSYSSIVHNNGKRAAVVSANAETTKVEPGLVVASVRNEFGAVLAQKFPDVKLALGGSSREQEEFMQRLLYLALLTLFGIYALMAIPLKSYLQPLIIMGVIPFGMIGAVIGHILVGIPFSFLSLFGIVALAGVVVNDSIILVDFVNTGVEEGEDLETAAVNAGTKRIRAILLTSLTTFFGLLPMLLERSLAAQSVIPMAVSLGFGILFATAITLFLIPCLYVILVDVDRTRIQFSHHKYESILLGGAQRTLKLAGPKKEASG